MRCVCVGVWCECVCGHVCVGVCVWCEVCVCMYIPVIRSRTGWFWGLGGTLGEAELSSRSSRASGVHA